MRNEIEFPITLDEVIECLERLERDSLESGPVAYGDMTPILLRAAIQVVKRERFLHGG
jgi:hypothetical protein